MKQFKIIFFLLASLLLTVSCDKDFEEINTDPNNPTVIDAHLLLPSSAREAHNQIYRTFIGADMGGAWAQHFSKVQYHDESLYIISRPGVVDGLWNTLYAVVISDADQMYKLAEAKGNTNLMAIALTIQAHTYGVLTDMFGDIPFSEAISADDGIFSPVYDSQEDVYTGILDLLTRANSLYGSGSVNSDSDIIYGGDVAKWQKFTNSLKFRSLMRISGKVSVSGELQALVNAGNMFGSNDDEATLVYLSALPSGNPMWETIIDGARPEYKINAVVVDMMLASDDPRLPKYAQVNDAGDYRGKPAGIDGVPTAEWSYANVSPIGEPFLEPDAPAYYMSNAELNFLMAEAVEKGYISGSASAYYEAGITASFAANGVADNGFIADNALSNATALQQIGTQNWLALYGQGIEGWTEWRRVGYPALTPAEDGVISEIPSRLSYPPISASVNATNYNAAVAAQGADNLKTKVWWNN